MSVFKLQFDQYTSVLRKSKVKMLTKIFETKDYLFSFIKSYQIINQKKKKNTTCTQVHSVSRTFLFEVKLKLAQYKAFMEVTVENNTTMINKLVLHP